MAERQHTWSVRWQEVAQLTTELTQDDPRFARVCWYLEQLDRAYTAGNHREFHLLQVRLQKGMAMSPQEVETWAQASRPTAIWHQEKVIQSWGA